MKLPILPMLATLVAAPFNRSGWVNEEKYDGIHAIACCSGSKVRLWSRNLNDITADFANVAQSLVQLHGGEFVIFPRLVAQIAFAEWTGDGKLRQLSFLGPRNHKAPAECLWREREL